MASAPPNVCGPSDRDASWAEGKLLLILTEIGDLATLLDSFTRPREIEGHGLANLLFGLWLECGEFIGCARMDDSVCSQSDARRFGVPAELLERLGRARASTAHELVRLLGRPAETYCEWTLEVAFWLRELLVHRVLPPLDSIARGHNLGESCEADHAIFCAAAEHGREWFLAEFADVAGEAAECVFGDSDLADVPRSLDDAMKGVKLEFRRLRSGSSPAGHAANSMNGAPIREEPAVGSAPAWPRGESGGGDNGAPFVPVPTASPAATNSSGIDLSRLKGQQRTLVEFMLRQRGGRATKDDVSVELWGDEEKADKRLRPLVSKTNASILEQPSARATLETGGRFVTLKTHEN